MQRTCGYCGEPFEAVSNRAMYCSDKHRAAASRKRRDQEVRGALDAAGRAVERAKEAMGGRGQGDKDRVDG